MLKKFSQEEELSHSLSPGLSNACPKKARAHSSHLILFQKVVKMSKNSCRRNVNEPVVPQVQAQDGGRLSMCD